jgi:hypothetical protein
MRVTVWPMWKMLSFSAGPQVKLLCVYYNLHLFNPSLNTFHFGDEGKFSSDLSDCDTLSVNFVPIQALFLSVKRLCHISATSKVAGVEILYGYLNLCD